MRPVITILLALSLLSIICLGADKPLSPNSQFYNESPVFTGTLDASSQVRIDRLPAIPGAQAGAFAVADDGTRFLTMRFQSAGAQAVRLHIQNLHLPEGAKLFVYGSQSGALTDIAGPYTGAGPGVESDFWTPAVRGYEVVVELQAGDAEIADLPFEITEIAQADAATEVSVATEASEVRTSLFRGVPVTHEVSNGMAVFESDILLGTADELLPAPASSKGQSRSAVAITGARYRWPNGTIPYSIDPTMPNQYRVLDAINHWNTRMAGVVKMIPLTTQTASLYFSRSISAGQCASYVGMLGYKQTVFVGDSCGTGNMIHEIGHAFGLWHEQSREDRNNYVRINLANISTSAAYNFNQNITDGDDINAYDFGSIMHYSAYAFSSNGRATIETIPAGIPIGQRNGLSAGDMAAIKVLYPPATTTTPAITAPAPAPAPVVVQPVAITVTTNPAGMPFSVDAVQYTTAQTFQWIPGSGHTISALNLSATIGTAYAFQGWSDAGAQSHNYVTPTSASIVKADYTLKYQVTATAKGNGTVTVTPPSADNYYAPNTSLTLSATPAAGSCFTGWSDLVVGTSPQTTITATKAYHLTASFQAGTVTLNRNMIYTPAAGGNNMIVVNANPGCIWSFKSPVSWIRSTNVQSGSASAVLFVQVDKNTSVDARSAVVTIGPLTLNISQIGAN